MKVFQCFVFVLVIAAASMANAGIIGTYVEAEFTNTDNAAGGADSTWGTTIDNAMDNLWCVNAGASSTHPSWEVFSGRDVIQVDKPSYEVAPDLVTTITGLAAGSQYEIRVLYACHSDLPYLGTGIRAGLTLGSMVDYDATAPVAVAGTYDFANDGAAGVTGIMNCHQALIGTATADTSGEIKVYVGQYSAQVTDPYFGLTGTRTSYDGLSYQAVPEPGTISLLVTGLFGVFACTWRKRK